MDTKSVIRFGGYRLDGHLRRLTLEPGGDTIPLGSRALAVLLHLAMRAGELATKADLMKAGWPDVTVTENSLTQCISGLRKALGPAGGRIVTEPGRGYRFVAGEESRPRGRDAWRTTDSHEAYQLYVSAWTAMASPGAESIWLAIERLEKAVQLDPRYAIAHALLGMAYACLGTFGFVRPRDVIAKARAPVLRALELDPLLAEAYAELAHQQATLDLDPAAATKSAQRARELDPDSVASLAITGAIAGMLGRHDEALACFDRCRIIEPLAPNATLGVAAHYYFKEQYREAIAIYEAVLELNPAFDLARCHLGRCYVRLGDHDRALAEFAARRNPSAGSAADVPAAHALAGRTDQARAMLAELMTESASRYVSAYDIATIHVALGDTPQALTWLEQAVEEAAPLTWGMKVDPALAPLRAELRFQALLQRIGAA